MRSRIKQVREYFEMSQAEFGEKINVAQRTVSNMESGVTNITTRNIEAICRVFNVSEEWLRYGDGEMFKEPKDGIAKLTEEYNLTANDILIIKSYLALPPEMRLAVVEFGKNFMRNMSKEMGMEEPVFEERPPDDKLTVDEKRRIMNEELDAEKKEQTSSAFIGTSGSKKRDRIS